MESLKKVRLLVKNLCKESICNQAFTPGIAMEDSLPKEPGEDRVWTWKHCRVLANLTPQSKAF